MLLSREDVANNAIQTGICHHLDAMFLLTIRSFLHVVEFLCSQFCFGAFLLTLGAYVIAIGAVLLAIEGLVTYAYSKCV